MLQAGGSQDSQENRGGDDKTKSPPKNSGKRLAFLSKRESGQAATAEVTGIMTAADLAKHVNDLADAAYDFTLVEARPYFWKVQKDVEEMGEEILLDPNINEKLMEYREHLSDLEGFCPENDPDEKLQLEAIDEKRKPFLDALCLRVRHKKRMADLVFKLSHAENKDEMIRMIENAQGIDGSRVFVKGGKKDDCLIGINGQYFNLAPNAFGYFRKDAQIKLSEAAKERRDKLEKAADAKEQPQETQKAQVASSVLERIEVSPEDLLFGQADEASEKFAMLPWEFQGHKNSLKLLRKGELLFVLEATGVPIIKAKDDLAKLRGKPYVELAYVLSKDGQHLCKTKDHEKQHYEFGSFIKEPELRNMLRWIRNAAGKCIPHRLLEEDRAFAEATAEKPDNGARRQRLVKPAGELMTDEEFYFRGMLGSYTLLVTPGFSYDHKNNGVLVGTYKVTKQAHIRLSRRQRQHQVVLSLENVDSEEVAQFLGLSKEVEVKWEWEEKGIIPLVGEFEDTKNWTKAPFVLQLALRMGFRRLKEKEAARTQA